MNLVMQFRKVCNHPELFERADVVAPFSFCAYGRPSSILREGDFISCHYSTRSYLEVTMPELLYHEGGLLSVPKEDVPSPADRGPLRSLMNIWSTDYIKRSLEEDGKLLPHVQCSNIDFTVVRSPFNFGPLMGLSPSEIHTLHFTPTIKRLLLAAAEEVRRVEEDPYKMYVLYQITHIRLC